MQLSYKGTNYKGWQIQPNEKTVQGEINKALTLLNRNTSICCLGCGRTDTGVHAKDFFAHFDFPEIENITKFIFKLNNMLPFDIVIHNIFKVDKSANARFDAINRTYEYHISKDKNAFNFDTTLKLNQTLDIDIMNNACQILLDNNDFECFSKVRTEVNNFICNISFARWSETETEYIFTISANRFLRNMVRSIVGTMIDIGQNKITSSGLQTIIDSRNRSKAGKSVSPNGLFLNKIEYNFNQTT
jgi:tRNA pseudouridine38-40 synthase